MAKRILPTLPEEVIIDGILVRVPARSIGRFRCVSKSWRSLLSSPHFTGAHLKVHIKHEPEGIILSIKYCNFRFCTVNLANESSIISRRFNHPSSPGPTELLGSCHGLLLVFHDHSNESDISHLDLFNPVTLETLKIPESSDFCDCNQDLGYDSLHDDYKIVSISENDPFSMCIYSVKTGTWKSLGNSPYPRLLWGGNGGPFVNGSIHWLASPLDDDGDFVVAAFSLAQEEFKELPLPKGFSESNASYFESFERLTVIGGCLAMMPCISFQGVIDFWVMQEYGVQDSWTKFAITTEKHLFKYIGVLGKDEIVFAESTLKLVSYNWRNGVWRDLVDVGTPGTARLQTEETTSFRESLISPKLW